MDASDLTRRDFNRLTMAAVGGMLAGSLAGCGSEEAKTPVTPPAGKGGPSAESKDSGTPARSETAEAEVSAESIALAAVGVERHVCRGLNACKNQGKSGANDCAGQGSCATVEHHTCGGQNDCKGQGGCGPKGVENDCKGKGGCHVPLMDDPWKRARQIFEAKMKQESKEVGAAPAKSGA